MSVSVQKVTEPVLIGEGPHWDEDTQALYFVSIDEKAIHKYVPETGLHTKTHLCMFAVSVLAKYKIKSMCFGLMLAFI